MNTIEKQGGFWAFKAILIATLGLVASCENKNSSPPEAVEINRDITYKRNNGQYLHLSVRHRFASFSESPSTDRSEGDDVGGNYSSCSTRAYYCATFADKIFSIPKDGCFSGMVWELYGESFKVVGGSCGFESNTRIESEKQNILYVYTPEKGIVSFSIGSNGDGADNFLLHSPHGMMALQTN